MPWWGWLLVVWLPVSAACAVWWGRALAEADARERAHHGSDVARSDRHEHGHRRAG